MASENWSYTTKRLVAVGFVIILLLVFYLFRNLLPPVAIAVVLAFILKPVADLLERRARLPRTLAVALIFVALAVLLTVIPLTVVPYVVDQFNSLNLDLQRLADDLIGYLSEPITFLGYSLSIQDLVGDVGAAIQDLLQPFAMGTLGLLFGVASSMLWVLSIFIISFYLVKDADRLRSFLDRIAPPGYTEELGRLREEINTVWKAFFRGQVLLGVVVGLVVWISMSLVGLPNAGLMGLIAGLLEVIPNFGPVLATVPALLIALFRGSTYLPLSNFWFGVVVLAIYTLIQQIENAYLVPRIMSRRLQLHPVVVFVGVLAGGILFGALGILLAAPTIGTIRVIVRYMYAKLLDEDPFPPQFVEAGEIYPGEIDAILFDLDGTLIETDDTAVETLARRLMPIRRILPKRDPARAARHILMSVEGPANSILTFLDRIGLDASFFSLGDRLRRMRGVHLSTDFRPVDGAGEMLRDLHQRYHLAIVTTRSCKSAQTFISQQGLTDLFDVIVGREDTWRIKPHPSPVRHAADQLKVPVERCLMVGDTTADIWAARAAGARSVGVLCGFGQEDELDRAGADLILDVTSDLTQRM